MHLDQCFNFHDFRELARRRLPRPIFNYIDGAGVNLSGGSSGRPFYATFAFVDKQAV